LLTLRLLPETKVVVQEAFGIEVGNAYGSIEAWFGDSWLGSELLHLNDDTVVFEFVDAINQQVPSGTRSPGVEGRRSSIIASWNSNPTS
jgi:phenylacetate-coenzyme A ligase PaaK-like adenylate-forming protein